MDKSIIVIGAGMGGLAAGIYGRLNGFATTIYEAHAIPGGQCTSWKRKGYTFDACIHHLFGCDPRFALYHLWEELGAMPCEMVATADCVSVLGPDGTLFSDYYDLDKLRDHMLAIAPGDGAAIERYLKGIRIVGQKDLFGSLTLGDLGDKIGLLPTMARLMPYLRLTLDQFAAQFQSNLLRRAFPLLEYSLPNMPLLMHLLKHAYGAQGGIRWPVGGARAFAQSMARRYTDLGGAIHYGSRVTQILTENGRAVGVRLQDGTEDRADYVVSNADGRKTIMNLLGGQYINDQIRQWCAEPDDETNWAVHVFLGVDRDLSQEPSALVMLLDEPVRIADHVYKSLEMQIYGFDPSMAPPGKGVIKVELVSTYSYWKALAADRARYEEEKQKVADQVIGILERRFGGIRSQVEAIDVPTLLTWERFMGGTHGFANFPKKPVNMVGSILGTNMNLTLPGLSHFYFAGAWATSAGALFMNALSGQRMVQRICRQEGKRFTSGTA
jgi:phytoene dehydrogenase-like protein